MKTMNPPEKPPAYEEIDVSCYPEGGLVRLRGASDSFCWVRDFDPGEAVKLWRCLMGECSTAEAADASGLRVRLWCHVVPGSSAGEAWELLVDGGAPKRLARLDADQAMALAWAIERCCGDAILRGRTSPPRDDFPRRHVWVLASKRMMTGSFAGNGAERLGGCERVFCSREAALDAVREFLRPLVNAAEPNPFEDVDEKLDGILDDHCTDDAPHGDRWSYDGPEQSFEVTLNRIEVEHGA